MLHVWRGVRVRVSLSSPTAYSRPTQPDITATTRNNAEVFYFARNCEANLDLKNDFPSILYLNKKLSNTDLLFNKA